MAEAEEAGDPMMQSPRDEDGATASGPNVAALREALEAPVEFTDLKVNDLENMQCSIRTIQGCHFHIVWMAEGAVQSEFVLSTVTHKRLLINAEPSRQPGDSGVKGWQILADCATLSAHPPAAEPGSGCAAPGARATHVACLAQQPLAVPR